MVDGRGEGGAYDEDGQTVEDVAVDGRQGLGGEFLAGQRDEGLPAHTTRHHLDLDVAARDRQMSTRGVGLEALQRVLCVCGCVRL